MIVRIFKKFEIYIYLPINKDTTVFNPEICIRFSIKLTTQSYRQYVGIIIKDCFLYMSFCVNVNFIMFKY